MRTTKGNVETAFKYFVQAIGGRVAERYDDHGAYQLDHAAGYGGYVIHQICDKSTGVNQPFGSQRHKAEQMYDMCWFAIRAIDEAKKQEAA